MGHIPVIERERERVAVALGALPGVEVLPSDANFLCFATGQAPKRLWHGLLDRGVLVRNVSGYPTLDRYLRVTVGTADENDAFIQAVTSELTS
jgi:histidinol-phosphate aminotransferase